MQIGMKLDQQSRNNIRDRIKARLSESGLKIAQIARMTKVDAGQVSRICRGEFRTLSSNVVQICNILDVEIGGHVQRQGNLDSRLVARLMDLWDGTPEDTLRLSQLLAQLTRLRRGWRPDARRSQRQAPRRGGASNRTKAGVRKR